MPAPFGNAELHQALMDADLTKLKRLHAGGVNWNIYDSTYGTPLTLAITMLDPKLVKFLLDHDADPNFLPKGHAESALDAAVLQKEVGMVKLLLAKGANPNVKGGDGGSPLLTAIALDQLELVRILLEAGADVYAKNKHGVNALKAVELGRNKPIRACIIQQAKIKPAALDPFEAARIGQLDQVQSWLSQSPDSKQIVQAAIAAACTGQNEVIKLLLKHGLDPNAVGKPPDKNNHWSSDYLVFWAISDNHDQVVQTLIEAGARIDVLSKTSKDSPLQVAVFSRRVPLVKLLLAAGADPLQQDHQGNSPLSVAKQGDLKQIAKLLEKSLGSRPAKTTSLFDAVRLGSLDGVKSHLAAGDNLEAFDPQGLTPLQLAVSMSHQPILELLINSGAKVQPKNAKSTWEYALTTNTKPEIIKTLLDAGLDVNQPEFHHQVEFTPLQYAVIFVSKNVEAVLGLMIDAGAKVDVTLTPQIHPELKKSYEQLQKAGSPLAKTIGGTKSLLELASSNRKALTYLKTRLGIAKDAYDLALEQAKQLSTALEDKGMKTLVDELSKTLHATPKPWKKRKGVLSYWVKLNKIFPGAADAFSDPLRQLAVQIQRRGAHLIYARLPEGSENRTELLFFPTDNPLAAMAGCGINGANYGIGTRDVINWFDEGGIPFQLIGCSYDFVDVRFKTPLADAKALLKRAMKFCPDLDGGEDFAASAAEFARTGDCFFWWD